MHENSTDDMFCYSTNDDEYLNGLPPINANESK